MTDEISYEPARDPQDLERLLVSRQKFNFGEQRAAIISGDLALTSTRSPDGSVTTEVARRQGDGTWLWVIDRFSVT